MYQNGKIDRFVIDEVHCVSHWGQDFRKDYLELSRLKKDFPNVPILGLTATATIQVVEDIKKTLQIPNACCFKSSFNRKNLLYEIRDKKGMNQEEDLRQLLLTKFKNKTGIIYCLSRKDCEDLRNTIVKKFKIKCEYYHAHLAATERS